MIMSCINTSTGDGNAIVVRNTEDSVPFFMMNFIQNLDPIIRTVLNLITRKKYTIDGTCVMAVALYQQGIFDLEDLQKFSYAN